MKLFGGGDQNHQREQKARNEEDVRRLEQGLLPAAAEERLRTHATRKGFFTSNLSPSELLLARQCGIEPVGQVMGTCSYHIGYQWTGGWSMEMDVYSDALTDAWRRAVSRLYQETILLKAHGVVGVRVTIDETTWGPGMLDIQLFGTAVRRTGAETVSGLPFISTLAMQDHWALDQAGYQPLGMVFGCCYFMQMGNYRVQTQAGTSFAQTGTILFNPSGEMVEFSQAFANVRDRATSRMNAEVDLLGARGVLGMDLQVNAHPLEGNNQTGLFLRCLATGTSVLPFGVASGEVKTTVELSGQL